MESTLLDALMVDYDRTLREELAVGATPEEVYDAVRSMDFLSVRSPAVTAAFAVRELPGRVMRWVRREGPPPDPPAMRLADMFDDPPAVAADGDDVDDVDAWVGLGEDRPHEIVFGATGAVWKPKIEWRRVEAEDFAGFDEPGYAKIAAAFSTRVLPDGTTSLAYEARTATTDEVAFRRFNRYWRLVRPFVGVVMKAALRTAADFAEREALRPPVDLPD